MVEEKVKSIISNLSNSSSTNYIEVICLSLAQAIKADYVFIAKLDKYHTEATTLSLVTQKQVLDNFTYALKSTPCEVVGTGQVCSYPEDIQQAYPDDKLLADMQVEGYVGIPLVDHDNHAHAILVALYCSPITNKQEATSLFLLFSGLINKELEKQQVLNELRTRNEIIEKSKEAILICDKDNKIISVNRAFTHITGYNFSDVRGKNPSVLSAKREHISFYQKMWADLHTKGSWTGELVNRKKNGKSFPEWLSINTIRDEDQNISHYVAFFFDISKRKAAEEKIYRQANFDLLTGVANRFYFMDKLTTTIHAKSVAQFQSALLFMDLDLFQEINDVYGHDAGDELLKKVAERLNDLLEENDLLARVSGDGFAILVNAVISEDAVNDLITRILISFSKPFYINDVMLNCTLSIGVVPFSTDEDSAGTVLKKAERAMYHAKSLGRSSYSYYTQELDNAIRYQLKMKADLAYAIKHRQLSLAFQPIVSLAENKVTKFEALVRWQHGEQWISPAEFIPLAEQFSLIKPLGEFVLSEACRQLKKLKAKGYQDIVFNVNRSVNEIPLSANENDEWLLMIDMYGLSPSDICFELTESALAPDKRNSEVLFNNLRAAGATIALDDFGTGYSSLAYIRRIPLDYIKIDRSFITDMSENPDDKILVSTIIAMTKSLGKKVVAEGVETIEQVEQLQQLGCDYIQGFYYSKPIAASDIPAFIDNFSMLNVPCVSAE